MSCIEPNFSPSYLTGVHCTTGTELARLVDVPAVQVVADPGGHCVDRDLGGPHTVGVTVGVVVLLHPPASDLTVEGRPPENSPVITLSTLHLNTLLNLRVRRGKTGGSHKLVKVDTAALPGPNVEQGDVVPAVSAGAAEWDKLLVLDNEADLEKDEGNR